MKTLRRGKTGGVFDFCDCDCGAGFETRGARGESRLVTKGGVGTLGGVMDRLGVGVGVAVSVEVCGVVVRVASRVFPFFGGKRPFTRPLFGGTGSGSAEPADSISMVASGEVGMGMGM